MSSAGGKAAALALIFGGLVCTVLVWRIFRRCTRKAVLSGASIVDKLNLLLYCLPGLYLAAQALELPFQLSDGVFSAAAAVCILLPTLRNLFKWGLLYGVGFTVCQGLMAAVIYLAAYTLAFAAVLALALVLCILMSIPRGALWIGLAVIGGTEFLVSPMGDGRYQDGNFNIYTQLGDSQLLGPDGSIYYIHRAA